MCVHDPLADFLTRIRNSCQARHRWVDVPFSVLNENVAKLLKDQNFIDHFLTKREKGKGTIRMFLRYNVDRTPLIRGIRKISNPGRRRYVCWRKIPTVFNGMGIAIVSTSQGVLVGREAVERKVGGELLCYVW